MISLLIKENFLNFGWIFLVWTMLIILELIFFLIPGVSFTSLLIALVSIKIGFPLTFLISIFSIIPAHLILRKDISLIAPDLLTLIPMIFFASFFGSRIIEVAGFGFFGFLFGVVKWASALFFGFLFGRNIPKKILNIALEPPINFLIFWKLRFIFDFLV